MSVIELLMKFLGFCGEVSLIFLSCVSAVLPGNRRIIDDVNALEAHQLIKDSSIMFSYEGN